MRAIIQDRYGDADVLAMAEVPDPTVRDDQLAIDVRAVSLNAADVEYLRGDAIIRLSGLRRPSHRIPGSDVAGVVVEVGSSVDEFAVGDEVFGDLFEHGFGAFAERVAAPASAFLHKPEDLSFEQVATLPQAGALAWQALHDGRMTGPGERVLISGAGGGVGSFAVQLAAALGAEVTGVDRADKEEFVRALGATHFIDFESEDYTRSGRPYDRIIAVQAHASVPSVRRALTPEGRYGVIGGSLSRLLETVVVGQLVSRVSERSMGLIVWRSNDAQIISALLGSVQAGTVSPAIDRTYPLAQTAEAFRRLAAGNVHGKAVIVID